MTYFLDANVIIRYLTGDHPDHSARATRLLCEAEENDITLKVTPHILCEVVYVLEGQHYGYSRREVSRSLLQLSELVCIGFEPEEAMRTALIWHARLNVDISDALLAALADNVSIYTFDARHFRRLNCVFLEPPDV